jgi:hypothetical protein
MWDQRDTELARNQATDHVAAAHMNGVSALLSSHTLYTLDLLLDDFVCLLPAAASTV